MTELTLPIIVVCSEGSKNPQEIIDNLRKEPEDRNIVDLGDGAIGFKFHNVTKYYENDIAFMTHEPKHINLMPIDLMDRIEGVIIYFDADNKDFLIKLPIYAEFIKRHNIELGILLCSELYDNPRDGITYKESKEYSYVLDVIELDRKRDNDDDEQSADMNHFDPLGYEEVLQTIRGTVWSNVNLKKKKSSRKDTDDDKVVDVDALDADLSGFEQLLTEVMAFKETTSSWSRNERLAYAEKFALAFDNLLQQKVLDDGTSDSDSESQRFMEVKLNDCQPNGSRPNGGRPNGGRPNGGRPNGTQLNDN